MTYTDNSDIQSRLAKNMSPKIKGREVKRYLIHLKNRDHFPEIKNRGAEDAIKLMSDIGVSEIILPNEHIISSVSNFEDRRAIKGTKVIAC